MIDFTLNEKAQAILNDPLLSIRARRMYNHYVEVRNEIKELGYNPFRLQKNNIYRAFRIDSRRVEADAGELGISDTPTGYWSYDAWMLHLQNVFFGRKVRIATEHPRTKRCISEFLLAECEQDLTLEQYVAVWLNYAVTVQTTDEENQALARGAQTTQHFFDDWLKDTYPQHNIKLLYKPTIMSKEDKARWYEELIKYCEERNISVELSKEMQDKQAKIEEKKQLKASALQKMQQEREAKRAAREQKKNAQILLRQRTKIEREQKRQVLIQIKEEKRLAREAKKAAKLNKRKKT